MGVFDPTASFETNVFAILQHLDPKQKQVFCLTLCSIWKHSNNKVWNNITESSQTICGRSWYFSTSWMNAQTFQNLTSMHSTNLIHLGDLQLQKPSSDGHKCNLNASFSYTLNLVGLGMCIQDDEGCFVVETEWLTPLLDVDLREALAFLSALHWGCNLNALVHKRQLNNSHTFVYKFIIPTIFF